LDLGSLRNYFLPNGIVVGRKEVGGTGIGSRGKEYFWDRTFLRKVFPPKRGLRLRKVKKGPGITFLTSKLEGGLESPGVSLKGRSERFGGLIKVGGFAD